MTSLALLLAGYSIFSALVLAITHFRQENYPGQEVSRIMGLILLLALGGLQLAHFMWLSPGRDWVSSLAYRMTLFIVAPAFYLFSQPLLRSAVKPSWRLSGGGHAVPLVLPFLLPENLSLPLAFIIGAGYLLWLARGLYALRGERVRFQLEMLLLGAVFAIALGVAVMGFLQAALPGKLFFELYAIAIGAAFFLVQMTLGLRPQLSVEVSEAARGVYANSTLTHVDCEAALAKLDTLMQVERVFENARLGLPGLAERLGLTSHQLSELVNVRIGKGFSRYLREQRVAAAKITLIDEAAASVLSVGMSVGFISQSNFYEAFREIEGMTPGQFRKFNASGKAGK